MAKTVISEKNEKYANWVGRVCSFLSEVGPQLGEKGTHCASFQSKPVLDKCPDVVYLGYNPHEAWEFCKEDVSPERFYEGNPGFYSESRNGWRVWRLANAFEWADYKEPITDGNFVFSMPSILARKTLQALRKSQVVVMLLRNASRSQRKLFMRYSSQNV